MSQGSSFSPFSASTFTGAAAILAGAGDNDVVRIGISGEVNNRATFLAGALVDGGLGLNDTLLQLNTVGTLDIRGFEVV